MEDLTIPGWAITAFGVVIVPWLIWLTLKTIQNDKDIAINTANDVKVNDELSKLNTQIEARFNKIDERIEKLDEKITQFLMQGNLFLSSEVKFLQQLVSKTAP